MIDDHIVAFYVDEYKHNNNNNNKTSGKDLMNTNFCPTSVIVYSCVESLLRGGNIPNNMGWGLSGDKVIQGLHIVSGTQCPAKSDQLKRIESRAWQWPQRMSLYNSKIIERKSSNF